jgi:hypothetical protein
LGEVQFLAADGELPTLVDDASRERFGLAVDDLGIGKRAKAENE